MQIQRQIESKLSAAFSPSFLDVINESYQHSVPEGSESHFKVVIVADGFDGQSRITRHKAVYQILNEEMSGAVHALTVHPHTPEEWAKKQGLTPDSPQCMGGSKAD